jgi:hypothetical protein
MGWLDGFLRLFRGSSPTPEPEVAPAPDATPVAAVERTEPAAPARKKEPKPPKPPKAPKPAKEKGSKKARKAAQAASEAAPRAEVLSVEEAERRYGAMLRAPKPPVLAPEPAPHVPEPDEPPPPPSAAEEARRAAARENRKRARVPQFQGLLSRADALLAVPGAELRHLRSAREELLERWSSLGPPPDEEAAALLAAKEAKLQQFDARIEAARAAVAAVWGENLAKKRAIVDEAKALAEREDLKGAGPAMGELRNRLRAVGPVSPEDAESVAAAFAEAEARLRERQEQIRTDRDSARREQLEKLERIVRIAESLVGAREPEAAAERAKELQSEWKTVRVPGPRGETEALWTRFRAACDAVFARRAEARVEATRAAVEKMEAIVQRAEALAEAGAEGDPDEAIHKLIGEWKKAGRAPREQQDALWERLQAAFGRIRSPQVDLPEEPEESLSFRPFQGLSRKDE